MAELQLGTKLKIFQSDNAMEHKGLTKFVQAQGVIQRFSCPHIHQQNGAAERKHRHIVEMGLTLLAEASLPLTYWGEAFTTAVQLINSLPTPLLNNLSPTEVLFGKKPPYNSFRVFGCLSFPFTRPYNKHKLDFKSLPCIFLGYGTQHKGYKCLTPSGKVILSRHVLFEETKFPFKSNPNLYLQTNPSPPSDPTLSVPTIPILSLPQPSFTSPSSQPSITSPYPHSQPTPPPIPFLTSVTNQGPHIEIALPIESTATMPSPVVAPNAAITKPVPKQQHNMTTRAMAGVFKPKAFNAQPEPKSVKEALSIPR